MCVNPALQAGGEGVMSNKHAATLSKGSPGVLHGSLSYLLQDDEGQIIDPHSISAGCVAPSLPPARCPQRSCLLRSCLRCLPDQSRKVPLPGCAQSMCCGCLKILVGRGHVLFCTRANARTPGMSTHKPVDSRADEERRFLLHLVGASALLYLPAAS